MIPAAASLDRVEAGEIDALTAARQLGVTRARVNQLLRRRRAGDPDPLTTTQIKHNRRIRTISRRGLIAADSERKAFGAGRRGQPALTLGLGRSQSNGAVTQSVVVRLARVGLADAMNTYPMPYSGNR